MGASSRTGRALPSSLARNILLPDARATAAAYHSVPAWAQDFLGLMLPCPADITASHRGLLLQLSQYNAQHS